MTFCKLADNLRRTGVQKLLLASLVFVVFGESLWNGFVWDDWIYFIDNPVYRDGNLRAIVLSPANGVEYLPLRDLTYVFDYLVWGKSPFGFHLTNLVLFLGNVLALYWVARLLTTRLATVSGRALPWFVPLLVAAGFAVHPINAEVVNFVTCRNVLVSGLCVFLSVGCMVTFLDKGGRAPYRWYAGALLAFVGSLLGKATAIMLPLLFLAILPVLFPGMVGRILGSLVPFYLVAAGFFQMFTRVAAQVGFISIPPDLATLGGKVAFAVQIPIFYVRKLCIPWPFTVEYLVDFSPTLWSVRGGGALVGLVLVFLLAIRLRRRYPELLLGVGWYLCALLPVLNFFNNHPIVSDRYAYLPAVGFMFTAASLSGRVWGARRHVIPYLAVLAILSGVSVVRSFDWRSDVTLWNATLRIYPDHANAHYYLAVHYYKTGNHLKALEILSSDRVPSLRPFYYYYKGLDQFSRYRQDEALAQLRHVVDNLDDGFIPAYYLLGLIAEGAGDFYAAGESYRAALDSRNQDGLKLLPKIRERLTALRRDRFDTHLRSLKVRVDHSGGDKVARVEYASVLELLGGYAEALEQYLLLEGQGDGGRELWEKIARCYARLGMGVEAVRYYEKSRAAGGSGVKLFIGLGEVYRGLHRYDRAIALLEEGVRRFPDAPLMAYHLALAYWEAGRRPEALSAFSKLGNNSPDGRYLVSRSPVVGEWLQPSP